MVKSKDADFEESKHKRDEGGKFSSSPAGHAAGHKHHEQQRVLHHGAGNSEAAEAHRKASQSHLVAQATHEKPGVYNEKMRNSASEKAHSDTHLAEQHAAKSEPKAKKTSATAVRNTLGSMRGHAGYLRELEHGQAFTHRPNAETGKFDRLNSHEAAERTLKNARELHGFVHTNSSDPKHHEAATKTLKNLEKLAEKVKAREPYSK